MLKTSTRLFWVIVFMFMVGACLLSCAEEKKQGKVAITEQEFSMRQDTENTFTIDAEGTVKNIGDVDVKKVVVTAYCRSCTGKWGVGQWQTSPDIDKMPQQMDVISYIPAGGEASFKFTEVADYLLVAGETAPEMPEKLEAVIESFETVQ